jgi:hypothetical protein
MKEYYGNYLGLCISGGDKDPEQRGRCQIFVPHIMPSLFEGWNEAQKDKQINILGTGLDNSLDPTIVNTLKEILPWAECATPIIGASPSGYVNSQGQLSEVNKNTAGAGASTPALGSASGKPYFSSAVDQAIINDYRTGLANYLTNNGGDKITVGGSTGCARGADDLAMAVAGTIPVNQIGSVSIGSNASTFGSSDQLSKSGLVKLGTFNSAADAPPGTLVQSAENHLSYKTQTGSWLDFKENNTFFHGGPVTAYAFTNSTIASYAQRKGITDPGYADPTTSTGDTPVTENPSSVKIGGNESPHQPANVLQGGSLVVTPQINTGRTIVSASGTNDSGVTNVTYSDGTTETLSGPRPLRNNNPGNLEYGDFAKSRGAVGSDGRYAVFPDVQTGTNAQISLLKSDSYNTLTVSQMVNKYAPPSENPNYLPKLINLTGLSPDTKLNSLTDEQFTNMVDKIQVVEGFKTNDGNIKPYMPYATAQGPNTNNQAGGMFGYAHEGALVWVFFQGGNPLFPVYFAASYGQKEWNNIYQVSSPGKPGKGATINLHGGGINSSAVMPEDGGADPGFAFQLYGVNGSALTFAHDQSQFYTPYIHREHIGGDRHEIVMANKESHIQGTHNVTIYQDQFVSIGDFSEDAKLAHSEIQEILEKIPDFYK